ncbi:MAG TPA: 7TM-DISM domain-containing protein, partial [Cryomorphaceae bacterium]|nr:7TM-DISM domain-containing protein [Cryomorphaceae bacterium]
MTTPRFVILFFLALATIASSAQEKVVIDSQFESIVLGEELGIYKDETGGLTYQEALDVTYEKAPGRRPNLGFVSGAVWLKTEVYNASRQKEFIYQINQPLLDSITVYFIKND